MQQQLIQKARTNLLGFIAYMMGTSYEIAPHHRLICSAVQEAIETPNARLMISLPPRHGKSMIVSEFLPAFLIGYKPMGTKEHIIAASYGSSLAIGFGKKVRRIVESSAYRLLFPEVVTLGNSDAGSYFEFEDGSEYFAVGRSGAVTGKSSTLSILDDMLKDSQEAQSKTILTGLHEWYDTTLSTRSLPGGRIIVMSTRWSEQDLQGYLLDKEPDAWKILNVPALCEDEATDPLGRKEGEALWPNWYSAEKLLSIKARNAYQFSALYQGNPVSKEGNTFNIADLRFGDEVPADLDCTIMTWDTASTTKETSCYTAGVLLGIKDEQAYILDYIHQRVQFPELLKLVKAMAYRHKPDYLLIEDASSGTQLLQILTAEEAELPCQLVPISKQGSKADKLEKLLYAISQGLLIFINRPEELIDELKAYPYGTYDDGIIALGHAITWWLAKTNMLTLRLKKERAITTAFFSPLKRDFKSYGRNLFTNGRQRYDARFK